MFVFGSVVERKDKLLPRSPGGPKKSLQGRNESKNTSIRVPGCVGVRGRVLQDFELRSAKDQSQGALIMNMLTPSFGDQRRKFIEH